MTYLQRLPLLMAALDKQTPQYQHAGEGVYTREYQPGYFEIIETRELIATRNLMATLMPIVREWADQVEMLSQCADELAAGEALAQACCDVLTATMGADWCAKAVRE